MRVVEQRVSYLEGQMNEYSHVVADIRETMRHLEHRMDERFDGLDQKMSRQFLWLAGMQMTLLIAVVGALIARG